MPDELSRLIAMLDDLSRILTNKMQIDLMNAATKDEVVRIREENAVLLDIHPELEIHFMDALMRIKVIRREKPQSFKNQSN